MKKALSLLLVLAMVFALCACGGKSSEAPAAQTGNKPATTTEAAPDYVYNATINGFTLESDENHWSNFQPKTFTDNKFYGCLNEGGYVVSEDGGSVLKMKMSIGALSSDGKLNTLFEVPERAYELNSKSSSYDYVDSLIKTNDGFIVLSQSTLSIVPDDYEGEIDSDEYYSAVNYEYHNYIDTFDNDGNLIKSGEIEYKDKMTGTFYAVGAEVNDKGNIVCCTWSSYVEITTDGELVKEVSIDSFASDSMIKLADGRIAVTLMSDNGNYVLNELDMEKGSLTPISGELPSDASLVFSSTYGDYDFFYIGGSALFGYNIANQKEEKIVNWTDIDLMSSSVRCIGIDTDGNISICDALYDESANTTEYITLKKEPYDPSKAKQVITVAGLYDDYFVKNMLLKFNRTSDKYRLVFKAYFDPSVGGEDSEQIEKASIDRLKTEMMAGDCPDMLLLNYLPVDFFAARGLLEDLYPYLDADKEYNRDNILPNILTSLETNGKLYQISPTFTLKTLMASPMVVGNEPGWNFDEVDEALNMMPEGCTLTNSYDVAKVYITNCLSRDFDQYIDWANGKVHLDTDEFKRILVSAKAHYPLAIKNSDENMFYEADNNIKTGQQLCKDATISSFIECMGDVAIFNGLPTFIGYPGSGNNTGSLIKFNNGIAICSSSKNKEACWEFARTILSDKVQKNNGGFPINKALLDKLFKDASTVSYKKDSNGNPILDKNGEPVKITKYTVFDNLTGEITSFYSLDEEYGKTVMNILTSTTAVYSENDTIVNIVVEEMTAYFEGQKSLDDVCKVIQSKANIYMNEQM